MRNFRQEKKEVSNFIFGLRSVIEAIKSGKEVDKLQLQNGIQGELSGELRELIKEFNIPFQYVPVEKLNRLTQKNHQGVIAFISEITFQSIEDILPTIFEKGETPLILILDRITDVRNFGAISRTAECAGVQAIVIPSRGAAQVNADAIKTSAGALHKIPVCRSNNLKNTINYLKESGLSIVSCTEKTNKFHYDIDLNQPCAIIMGSEEDGISPEYIKLSDQQAKLPLKGEIGSLNVSVAAGVILYEALRQRRG